MGFAFALAQGVGIATVLKWRGWPSLWVSASTGATLAFLLGAMVFSYELCIRPGHSVQLFLINASGLLVAWTLCAITVSTLRSFAKV